MTDPKILIVDDEPNILILMEQVLEDLEENYGVQLLKATQGEEALEIIFREKPDLIFLDVMLPKISGFEVCRRIKENPGYSNIYIVLLTAKGQEYDRETGLAMGVNCYMTKPFRPKEVIYKAQHVLSSLLPPSP